MSVYGIDIEITRTELHSLCRNVCEPSLQEKAVKLREKLRPRWTLDEIDNAIEAFSTLPGIDGEIGERAMSLLSELESFREEAAEALGVSDD